VGDARGARGDGGLGRRHVGGRPAALVAQQGEVALIGLVDAGEHVVVSDQGHPVGAVAVPEEAGPAEVGGLPAVAGKRAVEVARGVVAGGGEVALHDAGDEDAAVRVEH
jgi:hypothetical protein